MRDRIDNGALVGEAQELPGLCAQLRWSLLLGEQQKVARLLLDRLRLDALAEPGHPRPSGLPAAAEERLTQAAARIEPAQSGAAAVGRVGSGREGGEGVGFALTAAVGTAQ